MKLSLLIGALCLALVMGISGCGGGDGTSSETQVVIGSYPAEGPFAAISGRKGNKKPRFTPSGQPAPKKSAIRDLKVGSGPAAKRGDEVSFYYAGADHASGQVAYFGWPPSPPTTFELGFGWFVKSWEKTVEGMKVGGIREVVITERDLSEAPLDYVIVLTALRPQSDS